MMRNQLGITKQPSFGEGGSISVPQKPNRSSRYEKATAQVEPHEHSLNVSSHSCAFLHFLPGLVRRAQDSGFLRTALSTQKSQPLPRPSCPGTCFLVLLGIIQLTLTDGHTTTASHSPRDDGATALGKALCVCV